MVTHRLSVEYVRSANICWSVTVGHCVMAHSLTVEADPSRAQDLRVMQNVTRVSR